MSASGAVAGLEAIWPAILACAHAAAPPPSLDGLGPGAQALAALYLDFLAAGPGGSMVLAHLGQSLDGRIATERGHSSFVTGEANLVHMHRLRALADAVVVGAGTVAHDDPQLTVRHVPGRSPVRVVLDPERRLGPGYRIFEQGPPATLLICRAAACDGGRLGGAEIVGLENAGFEPAAVVRELASRGLRRLFIEGGGITVSRFLAARCLDRLQLCVAPLLIGSGRPAITLPPIATMAEALALEPELIAMGRDLLYACRLDRQAPGSAR